MNILIGVSAGIAAYKSATLIREFVKRKHSVRVVMTPNAKDFITPLTLATLSQNPVFIEGFSPEDGRWNSHISLGEWADIMVIAPATANTMAKMVCGMADNLLVCTYLSARCDVVVAPAMDLDMWAHVSTQQNLESLKARGVAIVEPEDGFLASGLVGKGRMAEPEAIAEFVCNYVEQKNNTKREFEGKKVMITSGSTTEPIDAVRFISNHSSGKMGMAIAQEFEARGAEVSLIMGQMSAQEMFEQASEEFPKCDIAVFAAAVADYTPKVKHDHKLKNSKTENLELTLVPTVDIAQTLSRAKRDNQFTLGFALETDNEEENARKKLKSKNLDAVVLNSLNDNGAGFGVDTNKVTIFDKDCEHEYGLKSKREVARDIVDYISKQFIIHNS